MIETSPSEAVRARLSRVERAGRGLEPPSVIEEALADPELSVRERAIGVAAAQLAPWRLVQLVVAGDSLARRAAAMEALAVAGSAAVPALVEGVEAEARGAVLFLLQVLGRIHCAEALGMLRARAGDPDPMLAQAALESLGHQRDLESLPILLSALQGEPWLAFTAINALGEVGDRRAVAPLLALREEEIYQEAVDAALERIGQLPPRSRFDA